LQQGASQSLFIRLCDSHAARCNIFREVSSNEDLKKINLHLVTFQVIRAEHISLYINVQQLIITRSRIVTDMPSVFFNYKL